MTKVSVIIAAAGKGLRAGFEKNKLLVDFNGENTLSRTFGAFVKSGLIDEYIVTASSEDEAEIRATFPSEVKIVAGGATRTESVKNALGAVTGDIVLIHDGARPFVTKEIIADCIEGAKQNGGAITALPSRDTVLENENGKTEYLGKSGLYSVQTPQGFKTELIRRAYELAGDEAFNDDGEVFKRFIGEPALVNGGANNVKLTYKEDFEIFGALGEYRTGTGFDCHKLVTGRKLILGGAEIPHDKGLLGHSDADALCHAITDAILSAAALRDIGYYFPDTDPAYKDANSVELMKKAAALVADKGYKVCSVSACIMADKPKLLKFVPEMVKNIAVALDIPKENVGIGATTLEGLGFVGREEGICTRAAATIRRS